MAETFTLKKDINNIPVCAFQVGANALNYLAWVAVQVVDDIQTTDASGVFTTTSKPILDVDGDGGITAADVLPRRTDTGVALYVGTAEGEVNSNAGEITLYTDEALTVPAANLGVKCTYWTLVPLAVDSSGRLVLAPTSIIEISGSALPTGAATEATLATLATEGTLQTIATQVTLAAVETILTAIRDTAGIKKIVDALPAGGNNIGGVNVEASVLPTDAATEATLATLATEATLAAIKDTAGIKKITDTVDTRRTAITTQTNQTHNAVVVAAGGSADGAWLDCAGFNDIAITMISDAWNLSNSVHLMWSHDGVNIQGANWDVIPSGSGDTRSGQTAVKARYVKVRLANNDGATQQTMSAWAYLKA